MQPSAQQPPSRAVLVACVGAGVVGAATLPLWRVGVGWCATALAVGIAIVVARSGHDGGGAGTERQDRLWRLAAAAAALALCSVAALRSAPWLVALCLGTGAALGSYALVGGRSGIEIVRGALALMPAISPAIAWAGTRTRAKGQSPALLPRVLLGTLAGLVMVGVFGTLLVSADVAFADLLRSWAGHYSPAELGRVLIGLTLATLVAVASAYLVSAGQIKLTSDKDTDPARSGSLGSGSLGVVEWGIAVAMLDALFVVFVFVQLTTLFAGDEYVLGPGGPDYAAHARGGFVQLLVVAVLTLVVVMVLAAAARRETARQRLAVRLLVGTLCLLTLVIVASALTRLGLYAEAYGFTVPRLLGYAMAVWLGLIYLLIIAAGVRLRARWLPRAIVGAAVGVLIALAAINPEALMARTHIARLAQEYPLDYRFLYSLSADAVAEFKALPDDDWCARSAAARSLATDDPWYAWNLAREQARDVTVARC